MFSFKLIFLQTWLVLEGEQSGYLLEDSSSKGDMTIIVKAHNFYCPVFHFDKI